MKTKLKIIRKLSNIKKNPVHTDKTILRYDNGANQFQLWPYTGLGTGMAAHKPVWAVHQQVRALRQESGGGSPRQERWGMLSIYNGKVRVGHGSLIETHSHHMTITWYLTITWSICKGRGQGYFCCVNRLVFCSRCARVVLVCHLHYACVRARMGCLLQ